MTSPDLDHRKPLHSVRFDRFFEEDQSRRFRFPEDLQLGDFTIFLASGKMEPAQAEGGPAF